MGSDEAAVRSLLERRVQVVAGKGGVGRTAVSCGLALRSARSGARTLLLEVNAPDNAARHLGVQPSPDMPRKVLDNLWLCRMTPAGSLREYALLVLRFKALYNLVFENPVVKYFLRSIPSLPEVTMMGKAWYHGGEKLPSGQPKYERIIIDAPATGHAVTLLSVSRVVADTVPDGILKDAAEKMAAFVESDRDTCLHVVAIPEEMPVNEGLQLAEAAKGKLRMAKGLAIANRVWPPLLQPGEEAVLDRVRVRGQADARVRPYLDSAFRRRDWEIQQREHIARFRAGTGMPLVEIPDLDTDRVTRAHVEAIASTFDRSAGAAVLAKASDG